MPRDNWRIVLRDFLKMFSICLVVWGIVAYMAIQYIDTGNPF